LAVLEMHLLPLMVPQEAVAVQDKTVLVHLVQMEVTVVMV
jgi:hypothetical protein